ncbi:hypothetical protein [Vallicoccus soli]|uniref:Uncharacterized protein n=1 Tax=Vallicoccus soli TaxID=2339232 RepID=A0A3A3Z3S3_9ACTN|nr:hypothetical protein [Vallicoccus soli]RJK96266.1 hypothetical protein D5H78_08355 [Vallicoccus soli]
MGEFATELRRRVLVAEQALLAARSDGDDYLQAVHTGELESLRRLAAAHGVALARTLPEQAPPAPVALPEREPVAG